jgi:hypothetical protein
MATLEREPAFSGPFLNTSFGKYYFIWKILARGYCMHVFPQEAQARFARARLCLPYNKGRKETLRPN